jgi:hypothetical protein
MKKIGNRSRRLSAKLREILLGIKSSEAQIAAVMADAELDAENKTAIVEKIRERVSQSRVAANRLEKRKQELAYEDRSPVAAVRGQTRAIPTHTREIEHGKWVEISVNQASCARAFFAVQECYAK